jgi:hypothetical protein
MNIIISIRFVFIHLDGIMAAGYRWLLFPIPIVYANIDVSFFVRSILPDI